MSTVSREMTVGLRELLPAQLPAYLQRQRWFGGKARSIQSCNVADIVPMHMNQMDALLLIVSVNYLDGGEEQYAMPLIATEQDPFTKDGSAGLLRIGSQTNGVELVLGDALRNEQFLSTFLESILRRKSYSGEPGELQSAVTSEISRVDPLSAKDLKPKVLTGEQSNSSVVYGDRLILKFFRRLEEGTNPEVEIGGFLTETAHYPHTPALIAWQEYRPAENKSVTLAVVQSFIPNQGDAWRFTLKQVELFYDVAKRFSGEPSGSNASRILIKDHPDPPEFAREILEIYLNLAGLLGRRTAELHRALASGTGDPAFEPEPFTEEFQRQMQESPTKLTRDTLRLLQDKASSLPAEWREKALEVAEREAEISRHFESTLRRPLDGQRIRIHGDYHLGQVLYTGSDFVIIDFEGEPARPLAERRSKQSPLQDVAGMLRSFHYAAFAPLLGDTDQNLNLAEAATGMEEWAQAWYSWVATRFFSEYFLVSRDADYFPSDQPQIECVLQMFVLEKAIYELGYELNNRPNWVGIPLEGILRTLNNSNSISFFRR
jgi:trehalose synthase-fused probable maltokinase